MTPKYLRVCLRATFLTLIFAGLCAGTICAGEPSAGDAELFARLDADGDGRLTAPELPTEHRRLFDRVLRRADKDGDKSLSREDFVAGLVPSRPEKPIEERLPTAIPQADEVRWLLLTMDTSGNSRIEAEEVPDELRSTFEAMVEQFDRNENQMLEQMELARAGPQLGRIAYRYARREGIDAAAELKKLDRRLGPAARRFDDARTGMDDLTDPQQARQVFARLDADGSGRIESTEVPPRLERLFQRLSRQGDRDRDGQLSRQEFLIAVDRLAQQQARRAAMQPPPDAMPAERQ
jgi:Ca2+-binding EF-hand superfamily protein